MTTHIVNLRPEEERNVDFGHADLFTARHAKQAAWRTILKWIRNHRTDLCE